MTDTVDCSSFTREASGSNGSGQVSWLPGHRSSSTFPGFRRVAALKRLEENGLSGYSGGTAQAFDLLPFSPSIRGAPRRNDETVTQGESHCQRCARRARLE